MTADFKFRSQVDDATKVQQYITNIDEMGKRKPGGKVEYGQRIQQIDIYYTAVGVIDIPQHFQEFAI